MIRKMRVFFTAAVIIIIFGLGVSLLYVRSKLSQEKDSYLELSRILSKTVSEKVSMENQVREKEKKLAELSNAQALLQSLRSAQDTITRLNKDMEDINTEKLVLQEVNMNLSSRLENTSREFMRTIEGMKRSGGDPALTADIAKLTAALTTNQPSELGNVIARLQAARKELEDNNKSLELKIQGIEAEKSLLQKKLDDIQKNVGNQDTLRQELEYNVSRLKEAEQEIVKQREAISSLNQELEKNSSSTRVNQGRNKEIEQDRLALQLRVDELQNELARKNVSNAPLQQDYEELKKRLSEKEAENRKIQEKIVQLENSRAMAAEELERQKARYEEANLLYNSIKNQVSELSNILSKKELELIDRRREASLLKEQVAGLQLRSTQLEQELSGVRDRQKRTLDDLAAAVKLNAQIQQQMLGISQSYATTDNEPDYGDKQRAGELKRKVEVILEPEK